MKLIPITQGGNAIVDDSDYESLMGWRWQLNKGYAYRTHTKEDGKRTMMQMHRHILSAPAGVYVDHINGNPLDNRRSNLRLCNNAQNAMNRGAGRNNSVGFKGVFPKRNKFQAQICTYGKKTSLGCYNTPEEAHKAYCEAAARLHGEFARTI